MRPLVGRKACLAPTLVKGSHKTILRSALLFASLTILAPLASAQLRSYNPADLNFDLTYSGLGAPDSNGDSDGANACAPATNAVPCAKEGNPDCGVDPSACPANKPGEVLKNPLADEKLRHSQPADFNQEIYYGNKLEFALDVGWHPINIPFPLDVFEGDPYNTYPLKYTLVPIVASLRWHINGLGGPWILRGNWDLTSSGSITAIPRGPETRYFSYDMGIRRNFVPRNWRTAPYWDMRFGLGNINAKGPDGVKYAQGETFTFTVNMGSGVRYNFSPNFAISAGVNYMHISNLGLSQHKPTAIDPHWGTINYGINTLGPMFGIDIKLGRHHPISAQ